MAKRTPALPFILITVLIDVLGVGIIIPIMPDLLINEMGVSSAGKASQISGILVFCYAAMQFFFAPILGGLSDKYGRRRVILISLFGLTIDYLLMGFAPTLVWLFIGRIIAGIGGASYTTASAYIADISTPEKRAQNFGMIGAAFGIGFVLGPILGGFLGEISVRLPFFISAGLCILNWLYGFFILPESLSKENRREFDWKRANPFGSLKSLLKYPILKNFFIAFFIIYISAHSVQSNWSFFGLEVYGWGSKEIGFSLGLVGILVALVQAVLIRKAVNAYGSKKTVYIGLICTFVGLVLFSFATEEWMIYTFLVVYVLGGLAGPTLQSMMSNQVPANEQGELMGAVTSLQSLGNIAGPLIMTNTFFFFTSDSAPIYFPGAAFALGAIFSLFSGLLIYRTIKNRSMD